MCQLVCLMNSAHPLNSSAVQTNTYPLNSSAVQTNTYPLNRQTRTQCTVFSSADKHVPTVQCSAVQTNTDTQRNECPQQGLTQHYRKLATPGLVPAASRPAFSQSERHTWPDIIIPLEMLEE